MKEQKSKPEIEYELKLTKKILERVIELNKNKDIEMPNDEELDMIEKSLLQDIERLYPDYKIQKK